jgi:hypothetical protein
MYNILSIGRASVFVMPCFLVGGKRHVKSASLLPYFAKLPLVVSELHTLPSCKVTLLNSHFVGLHSQLANNFTILFFSFAKLPSSLHLGDCPNDFEAAHKIYNFWAVQGPIFFSPHSAQNFCSRKSENLRCHLSFDVN